MLFLFLLEGAGRVGEERREGRSGRVGRGEGCGRKD
jgi:hypothetical protein